MNFPKFNPTIRGTLFFDEVKKEVHRYFVSNNVSPLANSEMVIKCVFWISFWALSYVALLYFRALPFASWVIGIAHMFSHLMIAFNVAHDANHFAFSDSKKINTMLGYWMEILGCNKKLWVVAHNQEHHTFINIHEHDNNIDGYHLLRFTPKDKWQSHHRFQWIYAIFIYAFSTLNYATLRDVKMVARYIRNDTMKINARFLAEFIFFKTLYYFYLIVIPIFFFNMNVQVVLTFFLVGHFINGVTLVFIFLTGHLTEETHFPDLQNSTVENNWAVHVIRTTGDYAPSSKIIQWFFGSLNLHVAHHLFPKICHVHYKHIAPIIKSVALKHGYDYRELPTLRKAIISHFKLLKQLGKRDSSEGALNTIKSLSYSGSRT